MFTFTYLHLPKFPTIFVIFGEYFLSIPNLSLGKGFPLLEDLGKSSIILKLKSIFPFINV